mmetsp:Transcript_4161/g.3068  ORF Transcript_4161/g.3068 Transcript_4161/m.3068 type:complete len:98 (+) Transcript_4161:78-371(+)
MNSIIELIGSSLEQLSSHFLGHLNSPLSPSVKSSIIHILRNSVPPNWLYSSFFCKLNITLVEWLELLTSKHAALSKWAHEARGTPRPCLKAALLVNP